MCISGNYGNPLMPWVRCTYECVVVAVLPVVVDHLLWKMPRRPKPNTGRGAGTHRGVCNMCQCSVDSESTMSCRKVMHEKEKR